MSWLSLVQSPTEERFALWLKRAFEARGDGSFDYDPASGSLRQGEQVVFLQNLYAEFVHAPWWSRPAALRRFANAFSTRVEQEPSFEESLPNLLPRVRDRLFFELLPFYAPGVDVPWLSIGEDFGLSIGIDSADAVRDVTQRDLKRWEKTLEELVPIAKHRLASTSEPLRFVKVAPGVYRSAWNDVYDASRIMLPGLLRQLEVTGRHVVTLPNRNTLFVAGEGDVDALLAMLDFTEDVLSNEPRPQTGRPLVLDGLEWLPFTSSDARVSEALARRATIDLARDQVEQAGTLDAHFQKTGRDCFVARPIAMQRDDAPLTTCALWIDGVTDALLPHTEYVMFASGPAAKRDTFAVAFDDVVAIVGHRMVAQDMVPARWQTTEFPTSDELAQLRGRAEPLLTLDDRDAGG